MISTNEAMMTFIDNINKIQKNIQDRPAPDWFKEWRSQRFSRFNELGIPTVKDEEWKYTNLDLINKGRFHWPSASTLDCTAYLKTYCAPEEINIVFVNGTISAELSNYADLDEGVTIQSLEEALRDNESDIKSLLTHYDLNNNPAFVVLNEALHTEGLFIRIAKNTVTKKLIHIVHLTDSKGSDTVTLPRTIIALNASSEATILESHLGLNDSNKYFANALTDIFLSDNAILHYCKAQKESLKAFHIGQTRVWQEGNSNFDGFSFMAGGCLARNDLNILLNGEGSNATLNALYSVYDSQHIDNHTSVDHRFPNCTSNQLYKGILNHKARAVFNGKIFVKPIAQQTNSYQLNKNLLLGKNCRVDTKPQLEIYADDVKCTHGATIGQLDEDELFYLQTRCIPKNEATKMLAHAFVDDLFNTIQSPSIHQKLNVLMQPSFQALL